MQLHGSQNAGRQSCRVRGHWGARSVGRDHYDRNLSFCRVIWQMAICDTRESPTLTNGPNEAAHPAASESDTAARVHSPSGINLWTTFKIFVEVPRGD